MFIPQQILRGWECKVGDKELSAGCQGRSELHKGCCEASLWSAPRSAFKFRTIAEGPLPAWQFLGCNAAFLLADMMTSCCSSLSPACIYPPWWELSAQSYPGHWGVRCIPNAPFSFVTQCAGYIRAARVGAQVKMGDRVFPFQSGLLTVLTHIRRNF